MNRGFLVVSRSTPAPLLDVDAVLSPRLIHHCLGCEELTAGQEYCEFCRPRLVSTAPKPSHNDLWPLFTRKDLRRIRLQRLGMLLLEFLRVLALLALFFAVSFL